MKVTRSPRMWLSVQNSFIMEEQPRQPLNEEAAVKWINWKRWLNYQSIVKQVPFIIFLTLLAIVYIYNGHYADKMLRKINKTSKEVKELKYEYIAVKSKVMFQSKQSELVKSEAIQQLGLKELTEAPIVLADSLK
ncbi:MAG: hypothetical protein RL115_1150 [Bacteroidota bacterium]